MLYQELPQIGSTPLDRWGRWLVPAVIAGAATTAGILLLLIGQLWLAAAALFLGSAAAAFAYVRDEAVVPTESPLVVGPDFSLVGAALALSRDPTALTSAEGSL